MANTLNAFEQGDKRATTVIIYSIGHDERSTHLTSDGITDPLTMADYKDPIKVALQDTTGTLSPGAHAGSYNGQDAYNDMLVTENEEGEQMDTIVRRLTPLECERLQGFPDGWTDIGDWTDSKGKRHKAADSPRYKALGNSIATPFWFYLLRRIAAQYERSATLGSLFDGIGGFPYCWEMCNGKGTAIWASEIEEFPIAVTKIRFPEEEGQEE